MKKELKFLKIQEQISENSRVNFDEFKSNF